MTTTPDTLFTEAERLEAVAAKASWKKYAEYRDSGVEWLGPMPRHWDIRRMLFLTSINPTKSEVRRLAPDTEASFVPMEAVQEFGGLALDATKPIEDVLQGYTYFRDGDIVVAKITPCFENGKGSIASDLVNGIGFGTTELHVIRPAGELDTKYLFYLTLSHAFRHLGAAEMYGAGGQKRVPDSFLRDFRTPIPPSTEQQVIAAFLDRKTQEIDELIEKKRRLIELLQEQRTALISHAVTKGLNPDAPTKPSGVEWLGDVPKHWDVNRLRFLVSEPLQYGANEAAELEDTDLPRYVRITDVDGSGQLRDETFKSLPEDVARPYLLRDGDLLLARSGATVGKAFFYDQSWGRCCYAGYLIRARLHPDRMVAKFAHYCTQSDGYWQWISSSFIQATIQNVSAEKYSNLWLGVPPLDEQHAIVAHLDAACADIKAIAATTEKAIERLIEYRQAMISAAVTGKIDVREEGTR